LKFSCGETHLYFSQQQRAAQNKELKYKKVFATLVLQELFALLRKMVLAQKCDVTSVG